ncbi:MAG: T9SS type A sorting domain-containing protein [Chitinophagaceae bacterium]|nr:MAG: T9SS type A sorting domain-containing protein [Chitinophagaceae bacterium]
MRRTVPALLVLFFCACSFAASAQSQSAYGFLQLNGRSTRQNAVISWQTIQELTITQFNIQQSSNGMDFETVGTRSAVYDTTEDRHQYQFTDVNAGTRGKLMYYRLEIAVNNGRMLYSKTLLVRFDESGEAQLSIVPNIVRSMLPLSIESKEETGAQLHIIDLQGRVLQTRELQLVKGMSTQSIDVSSLRSGSYIAVVSAPGLRLQQRFFHQ